jgi:hypothetical protein
MPFDNTTYPETETRTERDLRILRAAREGISKPGGWCQGKLSRSRNRHCAAGWIAEARRSLGYSHGSDNVLMTAQMLLGPDLPGGCAATVTVFNDTRSQYDVVSLFDKAIARLERERDAK